MPGPELAHGGRDETLFDEAENDQIESGDEHGGLVVEVGSEERPERRVEFEQAPVEDEARGLRERPHPLERALDEFPLLRVHGRAPAPAFPARLLDEPLVHHRVGDFQEARDVRAVDVVAGAAEAVGGLRRRPCGCSS